MYYNNCNNNNNGNKRRPKDLDYDGLFMEREERDPWKEFDRLFYNDPRAIHLKAVYDAYHDKKRMEKRKHTPLSADLSLLTRQDVDEILAFNKSNLHSELYKAIVAYFGFDTFVHRDMEKTLILSIAEFQQKHVASHYKAKDENGPDINGRIGPYTLAAFKQAKVPVTEINKHYLKKVLPKETLDKLESNQDLLNEVLLGFRVPQGMTAPIAPVTESDKNDVSFKDTVERIIAMYNETQGLSPDNSTDIKDEVIQSDTNDNDIAVAKQEALDEKINLPVDSIDKNALTGGEPLPESERTFFENKMNADFSDVKIHTDEKANESAENINADAYAVGNDIAFGKDKYQPGTKEGTMLMAHELGHVGQQKATGQPVVQRFGGPPVTYTPKVELDTLEQSGEVRLFKEELKKVALERLSRSKSELQALKEKYKKELDAITIKKTKEASIIYAKIRSAISDDLQLAQMIENKKFSAGISGAGISSAGVRDTRNLDERMKSIPENQKEIKILESLRADLHKVHPELDLIDDVYDFKNGFNNNKIWEKLSEGFKEAEDAQKEMKDDITNDKFDLVYFSSLVSAAFNQAGHINKQQGSIIENEFTNKILKWRDLKLKIDKDIDVAKNIFGTVLFIGTIFATGGASIVFGLACASLVGASGFKDIIEANEKTLVADASSGVSVENRIVENPYLVKIQAEQQRIAGIIQVAFAALQAGVSLKTFFDMPRGMNTLRARGDGFKNWLLKTDRNLETVPKLKQEILEQTNKGVKIDTLMTDEELLQLQTKTKVEWSMYDKADGIYLRSGSKKEVLFDFDETTTTVKHTHPPRHKISPDDLHWFERVKNKSKKLKSFKIVSPEGIIDLISK